MDRETILRGARVLDGGLASELEYMGANIDGPLWSAHVLEDAPHLVVAVHRAYIEAGADCILTSSYQVSRMGYAESGLPAKRADEALLHAVDLAREAAKHYPRAKVVVAASLGPYGAALHNGAEYNGDYEGSFEDLVDFHAERIDVLGSASGGPHGADLLAFETIPSLAEAQAIGTALEAWPDLAAWFSFTCSDTRSVAHGETLRECAEYVASLPQTVAIGVNCTHPVLIGPLIGELRAASSKPVVVYPNSGEGWDAQARGWRGISDPESYGRLAALWYGAGAQMVGGCCRTRPAHIREVTSAVAMLRENAQLR